MEKDEWNIKEIDIKDFNAIIIGSGAAGLNCALHLVEGGIDPSTIAIITEQLGAGTSFNAGSDKQTYYKLSIIGNEVDSPYEMAKDIYAGGAMHGDIALIEATNSIREFFHLIHLGVPFPHDEYGNYVGYKTDNDYKQRATSIGPLTSQKMCKCLLKEVQNKNIAIFDNHYAFHILLNNYNDRKEAIGIVCIKIDELKSEKDFHNVVNSIKVFQANNIIMATGGPASLYKHSVYPESQRGSLGMAISAGCTLQNLTESQFGIASIKFRWNLSGSYQQVIPRYFSVNQLGEEIEFLTKYFSTFQQLSKATFLKGYQWPFHVERIENFGSSLIDLAVYYETEILNNKVYLDFTKNPLYYDENSLDPSAKQYLGNSNALKKTPIERLKQLNMKALELYQDKGIDITKEPLEIAVCNQHLNGGVKGDLWWETNINHLFAIGEVNGSHGIQRPGGAALNSGQVGGFRAASKIAYAYANMKPLNKEQFCKMAEKDLNHILKTFKLVLDKKPLMNIEQLKPAEFWKRIQNRMSKFGGIIRPFKDLSDEITKIKHELYNINMILTLVNNNELIEFLRIKDALISQLCILEAIFNYHELNGKSRGGYLILREKLNESLNERYSIPPGALQQLKYIISDINLEDKIQTILCEKGKSKVEWEKVREIPAKFGWFENVWKDFLNRKVFH